MQTNHALAIALVCVASTASAAPPKCHKWTNKLSDCEALAKAPNCSTTGIEREVAMGRRFAPTAPNACKTLVKRMQAYHLANGWAPLFGYTSGEEIRACWFKTVGTDEEKKECQEVEQDFFFPKQTTAYCAYDANNDGKINWDDATYHGWTVDYGEIQPEAHCFCTANGPHSKMTNDDWEMEGPLWKQAFELSAAYFQHVFPTGLKNAILERNWVAGGSQLKNGEKVYKTEAIYKVPSSMNPNGDTIFDNESELQKWNPDNADAAQIDHIIPRKDSQGCVCGDVTPNNAAVISLELNQTMLNISPKWNINRARMYEKYVTCPDPSVAQYQGKSAMFAEMAFPITHLQADEGTICVGNDTDRYPEPPKAYVAPHKIADETGGCSAGGASGLGVAFAALAIRRRRKRDRR